FQSQVSEAGLATEVSFALGIPEPTAASLMEHSVVLVRERPAVLEGLAAGELSWRHAVAINEEIATLGSMGSSSVVDESVLEERLLFLAPGTTACSFVGKARRAREKMFPESIPVRVKEAFAKRKLSCDVGADGMAWLGLHMPAVSASGIYTRCTRLARAIKADGVRAQREADAAGTGQDVRERRTLAQLRVDIAAILLLGQKLPATATGLLDDAEATLNTATATGTPAPGTEPATTSTEPTTGTGTSPETGFSNGSGSRSGADSGAGSRSSVDCGGSGGLGNPTRPDSSSSSSNAGSNAGSSSGAGSNAGSSSGAGSSSTASADSGVDSGLSAAELYFASDPADPPDPGDHSDLDDPSEGADLTDLPDLPDQADPPDHSDPPDPAVPLAPPDAADVLGVVGDGSGLVDGVVDGIVEDPNAEYLQQLAELAGNGVLVDPPMPEALVLVKVPFLGLLGITDEPAELVGPQGGPVPEEIARKLLSNGSSFLRVLTDPITGEALPLEPQRYTLRAAERAVLQALAGCCYVPNCPNPVMDTELDHLRAFEFGGPSVMANLRPACKRHHLMKHFKDDKNRRGRRRSIDEPERAGIRLRGWTPKLTKDGRIGWITPSGKYRPPLNTEPDRPEYPKWLKKLISKTTKKPSD
ncbi:HNH endonuclease signature motif containing protein, partial [Arthrobacter sp. Sr24]